MTQTRRVYRPEDCRANFAGLLPLARQKHSPSREHRPTPSHASRSRDVNRSSERLSCYAGDNFLVFLTVLKTTLSLPSIMSRRTLAMRMGGS